MLTPRDVLDFWFVEHGPKDWFKKDDAFDEAIRQRFGAPVERALSGAYDAWPQTVDGGLALILMLDQFTRNLYRGTAKAFAGDDKALALAKAMIDRGDDLRLAERRRVFVYMPLEHSEDAADQALCVKLVRERLNNADFEGYALAHQRIVDRFGRFPHRNAALGRPSTAEEEAFLKEPNSSF
jgi:uncharacterized protein (DUF924 family)